MRKIREIIEGVDLLKPNNFPQEMKLRWLSELEGKIAADVMLMSIADIRKLEYRRPEDLEKVPLVTFPHSEIYDLWLLAKIDFANGEYNKYQNSLELFNTHYGRFVGWFARTYEPAQGYYRRNAVAGGYAGTESECARKLAKDDEVWAAKDEKDLQRLLDEGKAVLVTKQIRLTKPVVIRRSNTYLAFGHDGQLNIEGKSFPAIRITKTAEGGKPAWVRIDGAKIVGDWTPYKRRKEDYPNGQVPPVVNGSVGIEIQALGYNNHINFADIRQCEYGIQITGGFDCAQQNTLYEPYICNCRCGIDDRTGGMQNIRIFGGRIENNREYGIISASPNMCFMGTMIQGNDLGEVKLLNTATDEATGKLRTFKSGATFDNCYFEHLPRYERDEYGVHKRDEAGNQIPVYEQDEAGNPVPVRDMVIQLGDETQGNGWFGALNMVGCKIASYHHYVIGSRGRGAVFAGIGEENMQFIQMLGCSGSGERLFYLPRMDHGCRVMVLEHRQGLKDTPAKDVGPGVTLQYLSGTNARLGAVEATGITGVGAPLSYARTRRLQLEPYAYETDGDGSFPTDAEGMHIPVPSYGHWLTHSASPLLPWEDENAGTMPGSLHYVNTHRNTDAQGKAIEYKTPGWFVRTVGRGGADDSSKWGALVPGDAWGVQQKLHGRDLRIEAAGSDYGSWITVTYSASLPWEYPGTGSLAGSLHYTPASDALKPTGFSSGWYVRVAGKGSEDTAAKWQKLVLAEPTGTMRTTLTRDVLVVAPDNTAIDITHSRSLPWLDAAAGKRDGSLHYCASAPAGWYQRTVKLDAGEVDTEANWSQLVRADTERGLPEDYIPMIGKKAAILGDSLARHSAGHDGAADEYGFFPGTQAGDGWFARIARKYGMEYRMHGYAGARWYCTEDRPDGGVKAVDSLVDSGYVPDYVILEYGTNDIWSGTLGDAADSADAAAASTAGALRYCVETLQTRFPSARIIAVMPCMRNGYTEKQDSYYALVRSVLREYGVRHVDMLGDAGIAASMMAEDRVHLASFVSGVGYINDCEAVAKYSRCLEAEMLKA